jgi:hypothetical protein
VQRLARYPPAYNSLRHRFAGKNREEVRPRRSGSARSHGVMSAKLTGSRQLSSSTGQLYGLERVTRLWGVAQATIYRYRHRLDEVLRRRHRPLGAMSDEDLLQAIRQLLANSPFHGESYRKLRARRRFKDGRASSLLPRSRSCAWRCWPSGRPTTRAGSSSDTTTEHRSRSGPSSGARPCHGRLSAARCLMIVDRYKSAENVALDA